MKLAWATDIHLDMCPEPVFERHFLPAIGDAEALILTGDIADGRSIERWLMTLSVKLHRPIYFVLGNHDFYHRSIAEVRASMRERCASEANLHYLSDGAIIDFGEGVMLVGHDGWGDARLGDFLSTMVELNDHRHIEELRTRDRQVLLPRLQALGAEAAENLRDSIARAIAHGARRLLVATHVPPFLEASWYEGKIPAPDDHWVPNFTCGATGEVLRELAAKHPRVSFTVLCGHTHGAGTSTLRENLVVHTGGAEYGLPGPAGWVYPLRKPMVTAIDAAPPPAEPPPSPLRRLLRRLPGGLF